MGKFGQGYLSRFDLDKTARLLLLIFSKLCYYKSMYNWSVDEKKLSKDPEKYTIWKLEQLIDYGLNGEKIKESDLKKYWNKINIDPARRCFFEFLLNAGDLN